MGRGRLLFWLYADIARLDKQATSSAGGYDDDFRETTLTDTNADGIGEPDRYEMEEITVKAQLETDRDELQRMSGAGDVPDSAIGLVLHMRDLERAIPALVDEDGVIQIQEGDRLVRTRDRKGNTVQIFDPAYGKPKLYCTHVVRLNAWLDGRSNLALVMFGDRPQGRA